MPGQVEQYIDPIGADARIQLRVRHSRRVRPV
jgi:hypothetical protein